MLDVSADPRPLRGGDARRCEREVDEQVGRRMIREEVFAAGLDLAPETAVQGERAAALRAIGEMTLDVGRLVAAETVAGQVRDEE